MSNLNVNSILISGTNIFVGTDYGVFLSTNDGNSWLMKNQGFTTYPPTVLSLHILNNFIYAGTDQHSVWRRSLPEFLGLKIIIGYVPITFSLSQNYPNPFNASTNIKFTLPKSSEVKITVHDITGKLIDVIVNEKLDAGTYATEWDGSNNNSGIYFYSIKTESFSETRKMVLIK